MIWFTSDFHFGHEKDFLWAPRGFQSWQEAGLITVQNYNSVVAPEDTVYILGDCMLNHEDFGLNCLHQLNGTKHLIIGNHDTDNKIEVFKHEGIFESIQFGTRIRYGKFSFWLSHFPMAMGIHKPRHPVWNLSGHVHDNVKMHFDCCCYNVVLNAHNNFPVNIDTVVDDIRQEYMHQQSVDMSK